MVISGLVTASGIVVCGVSVEKNKSLTLNNMKNKKYHTVGTLFYEK
jgi:hypothetical protein